MDNQVKTVAIVGGGASGLVAAIAVSERARELGCPVCVNVYEKDDRVGRSILVTGNGRCNFSNAKLWLPEYHNADFVKQAYACFEDEPHDQGRHVVDFLESCGLAWREEPDGRRYPLANKASVVVDVLRASAARLGVHERCESLVKRVELPREQGKRYTLRMKDGVLERADAVVVACGGKALSSLEVEGLQKEPLHPVLGPLRVSDADIPFVRELDNIRVRGVAALWRERDGELELAASEKGEVLFRKYGVSGICVFNLSRLAQPGDVLSVSFLSSMDVERAECYLRMRRDDLRERFGMGLSTDELLRGLVLPRVADALMKRGGIDPDAPCDDDVLELLVWLLVRCKFTIAGIGDPDVCQVHRGGLLVDQFDPSTMAAYGIAGLYATGEALDVDGPCGGYNLHWAWSSGLIAGRAVAEWLANG